ncbi:MAG: PAS domain-containing sensor histidine kinase [Actinobacteria bacterium]|nr:PAS domain-containing sensor histidine kinase [Actinomycetota bacterium]
MSGEAKTRAELEAELYGLRQRIHELERSDRELQRVRKSLEQGAEALSVVLENSHDILVIVRADGTVAYASPSLGRSTGYRIEELLGINGFDLIHPDDVENVSQEFFAGLQTPGRVINLDFRYRHADGSWHSMEAQGINLADNPVVSGMVLTARDISDRKVIEQALSQSERYMRTLIENITDVILILDREGKLTFISSSFTSVLGYEPGEYIGHDPKEYFTEALHPDDVQRVMDFVADSLRKPGLSETIEFRMLRADGSERTIETRANNLPDDPVIKGVISTMRDITEKKKVQETIAARERYYRSLIRNAADMVTVLDENLAFRWGSPSAARITGYGPQDAYGKRILDFLHPDDRDSAQQDYDVLLANPGMIITGERRFQHKDGLYHWHEAISTNLLHDPFVQGIVVNSRDITERKVIEEMLLISNRELDSFATTVSHDLRTPLSLIEGYAQLMRAEGNTQEENEAYLKSIITAARRLDEMTESLLEYAQAGQAEGTVGPVEPLDIISDILFEHSVEIEKAGIDIILGEEFPTLEVDRFKLRQVFTNLIDNAVKYLVHTARPRIEIGSQADHGTATFLVRDNGPGLDPALKEEIFQPFKRFVTSTSPGLGIGLSTVKRAVEGWGGRIWVESEPEKGATFYFTAPLG